MIRLLVIWGSFAVLFVTSTAFAERLFVLEEMVADGSLDGARTVILEDMDQDGDVDGVVAAMFAGQVVFCENDGDGNFTASILADHCEGANFVRAVNLNQDEDGFLDLLVCTAGGQDEFLWLENNGSMEFATHVLCGEFDGPLAMTFADLDNDGDLDVIGAASGADVVAWFENNGDMNFTTHTILTNYDGAAGVEADDIDNDGDVDLYVIATYADRIDWLENDGQGEFESHSISASINSPRKLKLCNLNGDDHMDVIAAMSDGDYVAWWASHGNGNFNQNILIPPLDNAYSVATGDIDGDGDEDVIAGGYVTDTIFLWENDNGAFLQEVITEQYDGPIGLAMADLDGDTDMDFACAGLDLDGVSWWRQSTPPGAFNLIRPAIGQYATQPITFQWHAASDTDLRDSIVYILELSQGDEDNFHANVVGADTTLTISGFFEGMTYYWRIRARYESNGLERLSDETWHFVANHPPAPFSLLEPLDSTVFGLDSTITLSWEASNDPSSEIRYDVYLTTDRYYMDDPAAIGLTDTQWAFVPPNNELYFWTVVARDEHGGAQPARETWSFIVDDLGVESSADNTPSDFTLNPAYPNPFNGETRALLNLPEPGEVQLAVYNLLGQCVKQAAHVMQDGRNIIPLDMGSEPAGVYFLRIGFQGQALVQKLYLVK